MRFNFKDFKFTIKTRRFKKSVWEKYFSLKKKKDLSPLDKHWIQQFRSQVKMNEFKLIGQHLPTKTSSEWVIQKDLIKEKLDKKNI